MRGLTSKAKERLACVVRHRAVDTEMLRRLVAPDVSPQGFRAALGRLRDAGLVGNVPRLLPVHEPDRRWNGHHWYATDVGVDLAVDAGLAPDRHWRFDPEGSPKLFDHLDMANEVFLRLVEAARDHDGVTMGWQDGEHEVGLSYGRRSSEMVVVDLLAWFAGPDGQVRHVAVEVDRSTHALADVARKVQLYHRCYEVGHWRNRIPPGRDGHEFPRVLFVFENETRLGHVAERVAAYGEEGFRVDASTLGLLESGDPFGDVWTALA